MEVLEAPCGPTFSCHPRSSERFMRNREEKKEDNKIIGWVILTKNHCADKALYEV